MCSSVSAARVYLHIIISVKYKNKIFKGMSSGSFKYPICLYILIMYNLSYRCKYTYLYYITSKITVPFLHYFTLSQW